MTKTCPHITSISKKGLDLIKQFEGYSSKPYRDSVGVPTIGYGNTYYENGTRVTMADKPITKERAEALLRMIVAQFEKGVDSVTNDDITQAQFDALVSFAYNLGVGNLRTSTLLKKVNRNPADASIRQEFARWDKAGGKVLAGLTRRRKAEAELYFSKP